MALTALAISKLKANGETQRKYDSGGLYLEVSPTGGKWWRWKYRYERREKRLSLGTFPDTGLLEAREKRDAARKLLASGIDPGEERKSGHTDHQFAGCASGNFHEPLSASGRGR